MLTSCASIRYVLSGRVYRVQGDGRVNGHPLSLLLACSQTYHETAKSAYFALNVFSFNTLLEFQTFKMRLSPSQLDEIQTVQLNAWEYTLPWYSSGESQIICGSLYLGGLRGLRTVYVEEPLISKEDKVQGLRQCNEFRAFVRTLGNYLDRTTKTVVIVPRKLLLSRPE